MKHNDSVPSRGSPSHRGWHTRPAVMALAGLLTALFIAVISPAANAQQTITCTGTIDYHYSPGLRTLPQDQITMFTSDFDGQLTSCTGDLALTSGEFKVHGRDEAAPPSDPGPSCAAAVFTSTNTSSGNNSVNWTVSSGETSSTFDWTMPSILEIVNQNKQVDGTILSGRYAGGTYVAALTIAGATDVTDCATANGLQDVTLNVTLTITVP